MKKQARRWRQAIFEFFFSYDYHLQRNSDALPCYFQPEIHCLHKTSLHASQQIGPGAVKRLAKSGEHFYAWVRCSGLNSLKLPSIYLRLVSKLFLRQSKRHP